MAKYFKDTESFVKAAGEKYGLSSQQRRYLRELAEKREKERERRKKKALSFLWFLLAAAALLLVSWLYFRKPVHTFPDEDKLVMHFIDVGQGDCTFIAANGVTMLVDCGEDEASGYVVSYLRKLGVGRLDHVIATHPHSDHMGGMYRIIDVFDVGDVIIPHIPDEQMPDTLFYERFIDSCEANNVTIKEAAVGQTVDIGSAKAEIVAPDGSFNEDINNYSVSFVLTHGDVRCLFTGDAEAESEAAMLQGGRLGKMTLYKAGHHGSAYSSTEELIDVIRPKISVISCGRENSYGHPARSTLKRLTEVSDKVLRTDVDGTVTAESDGREIKISSGRKAA